MKINKFLAIILFLLIILAIIITYANVVNADSNITYTDYTIQPGETLWDIAQRYYPNSDIRVNVWQIEQDNGIDAYVKAGQEIKIRVVK